MATIYYFTAGLPAQDNDAARVSSTFYISAGMGADDYEPVVPPADIIPPSPPQRRYKMIIINGVETAESTYIFGVNTQHPTKVLTGSYQVLWEDTGMTLVMSNGSTNSKFALPLTGEATHVGCWFTFSNVGTGTLEIEGPGGSVKVADNAQITSGDDVFSTVTLQLVSATQWSIVGAHGTWTSGA